ncbi:unnamed protein product [Candidula unifasciata]|uniref:Uncharacterized protein n=1 Tax=Candidula unifasciata TaxID=100452 RepID=A0A8S3ZVM2_9EUPU|nr:unnamed protein product [Candidula unifasciata]
MVNFIRSFLLLIFCAVLVADEPTESDQKRIMDFISVLSGSWSNKDQVATSSGGHDLVEGYARHVEMPALADKFVLLVENAVNNRVVLLNVVEVVLDETDKNLIRLKPYEFTDPRKYKPKEFSVDDLRNITRDELKHDPDCVDNLARLADGVYSGICAMCGIKVFGRTPGYAVTITCEECTGAFPLSIPAKSTTVPYIFRLIEKYPLLNAPANYVSPCDKKLGGSSNSTQG